VTELKAMLLAAGLGTRLRPITDQIPKCMLPIAGKPLLETNVEWLRKFGFTELVINLYSLPQVIIDHFGDGYKWGVHITYSLEEKILGTAGGVKRAAQYFDNTFLVWYGDNLSTCNLADLVAFHQSKKGLATVVLFHREDVASSGIIELDEHNRIVRYLEKPQPDQIFSHWVNAGIYILQPEILINIPSEGESDFGRDIFPMLLQKYFPLYGYTMSDTEGLWWVDTIEDLQRTQLEIEGRKRV
jgi:NDP-sugar pyrophosphorylase family protein